MIGSNVWILIFTLVQSTNSWVLITKERSKANCLRSYVESSDTRTTSTRPNCSADTIISNIDNKKDTSTSKNKSNVPIRIPIISYQDEWVCVNKPAGISTHPSKDAYRSRERTLVKVVKKQLQRKVFPVHRLDHRTSGSLLFAFNATVCGKLHDSLRHGTKEYIALVRGVWDDLKVKKSIIINSPIRVKDKNGSPAELTIKNATTKFTFISSFSGLNNITDDNGNIIEYNSSSFNDDEKSPSSHYYYCNPSSCTLVLCEPIKSGRKHQIRKHLKHIGYPIIGDTQHGDTKVNRWWRRNKIVGNLNRLALHCLSLNISLVFDVERGKGDDSKSNDIHEISSSCSNSGKSNNHTENNGHNYGGTDNHISLVSPLTNDLRDIFVKQQSVLQEFWNDSTLNEPRLSLPSIDIKDGTYGRYYRQKRLKKSGLSQEDLN